MSITRTKKYAILFVLLMLPSHAFGISSVTITNKMIDGKKVWSPAKLLVEKGKETTINIVNTLNGPHGFEIPGIVKAMVIPANSKKNIKINIVKAGNYKIKCHIHPAHVGSNIEVK